MNWSISWLPHIVQWLGRSVISWQFRGSTPDPKGLHSYESGFVGWSPDVLTLTARLTCGNLLHFKLKREKHFFSRDIQTQTLQVTGVEKTFYVEFFAFHFVCILLSTFSLANFSSYDPLTSANAAYEWQSTRYTTKRPLFTKVKYSNEFDSLSEGSIIYDMKRKLRIATS